MILIRRLTQNIVCASVTLVLGCGPLSSSLTSPPSNSAGEPVAENQFLSATRQVTFVGRRAGEGYFSADGNTIVFQSEREPNNPFYQIYTLERSTGQTQQISTGTGKTTCAWLHPDNKRVLYASTHGDPRSGLHMRAELQRRAEGKTKPYQWDYDPHYDLYEATRDGKTLRNLSRSPGYDAEGSYSPDGEWIVFSSNRHAYLGTLSSADRKKRDQDPSFFLDLYRMRSDGSSVERLTTTIGYDGGAFFSGDGRTLVWRRFDESGRTAEIFTMDLADPTRTAKQVTKLGVLSWAPYLHPTGDYIIFASNRHGMKNFELYLVDTAGERAPVRVTTTEGFDGLPVFSPSGTELLWTSGRTSDQSSQLFIADWNDEAARAALNLPPHPQNHPSQPAPASSLSIEKLRHHIEQLASEQFNGRRAGTLGEELATEYAARHFAASGLAPFGEEKTYFQKFQFQAGAEAAPESSLRVNGTNLVLERDWRPISFSASGPLPEAPLVFAGYGMFVPTSQEFPGYNSYAHLDVKGRWVVALRGHPEQTDPKKRELFHAHMSLREKTRLARDRGAIGIIFVTGPRTPGLPGDLVPWRIEAGLNGQTSTFALSLSQSAATTLFPSPGGLAAAQERLDAGQPIGVLATARLAGKIVIKQEAFVARNVLGRIASRYPDRAPLVIGAHIDHLGRGAVPESLGGNVEEAAIHFGADDNASGSALLLEVARETAAAVAQGALLPERDIVFALWSGEELGLLGSAHFTNQYQSKFRGPMAVNTSKPLFFANLNFDMVGRLRESLAMQGVGSSNAWRPLLESIAIRHRLPLVLSDDSHLPTDSTSFYLKGAPVLTAFTGLHAEYHTPRDVPSLINYGGLEQIATFALDLVHRLAGQKKAIAYTSIPAPKNFMSQGQLAVTLGTIPDYTSGVSGGMKISGVKPGGPAAKGGLIAGDIITAIGKERVENIYDYTAILSRLAPGKSVTVSVRRGEELVILHVIPQPRE